MNNADWSRDGRPSNTPRPQCSGPCATLQTLAELMQPQHGAEGLSGLAQRTLRALGMDLIVIARCDGSGSAPEPLVWLDRLPVPDSGALLAHAFVRRATEGTGVVHAGATASHPDAAAFARSLGLACCAALPLRDSCRNVLGVMVCAARQAGMVAVEPDALSAVLGIIATRFAAQLELRVEHERGRSRALKDSLTGLPNRMLFNDRLDFVLQNARRSGEVFAVLFVDLDRFKQINDSLGHAVGDQVLVAASHRLRGALRASDTVARYAGDEFTVIVRGLRDRANLGRVTAKLLEGVEAPLELEDGSELHVTASIGVSIYPDDAADAEGLVKHADMAMYSAKGGGRNQVQAYGNVPGEAHRQRHEMETRLREAEARGELSLRYQPRVELASGNVAGVEVSVRWRHPTLGTLGPAFFIPLAEETGLIISIGEWVLRHACADVASWRQETGLRLRLAVKLSALQWMQPNLLAIVAAACREAGLAADVLDLETTAGVLENARAEVAGVLDGLHGQGCRIVVADAATGYRARSDAARLPLDGVKIDPGFVHNIGRDPDDEAAIVTILDAAGQQGLHVVAEGVETACQSQFLREHGCETAQGGLFSRAVPAASVPQMLSELGGHARDGDDPVVPRKLRAQ